LSAEELDGDDTTAVTEQIEIVSVRAG